MLPTTMSLEERTEMDEQAHSEMMMRLADDVARQVVSITDAKSLWKALEDLFMTKSLPSRISLLCRLFTFKMDVNMTLNDNLDKFLRMTQELERCDDKIKETHQAVLLLNSLPAQFDILKDVIQFSNDNLTKTKIIEAIIQKNDVLKVFKAKTDAHNVVKTDVRSDSVLHAEEKPKNNKKANFDMKDRKCFYCGKIIKSCQNSYFHTER